jgi:nicotinamide phosphoribosyltransferase
MTTRQNPAFMKDAYKTGHIFQYPPDTEYVYSNLTARGAQHFDYADFNGKIVTYGFRSFVQEILVELWNEQFFKQPAHKVIAPYQAMINSALGHNAVTTGHLMALHDLGFLPLQVKALPEGKLVNLRVPLMTAINTLPDFAWLTNFLETIWSNETHKPITVATIAYEYRRIFTRWAEITGASKDFIPFQGHDFSARGMAGHMDSRRCGVGHLLSFVGSDTLEAGQYACDYYGASWAMETIQMAPPATEHAVMCLNYALYGELDTFRRLITEVYPAGMVAIVSDTIDLWKVLTEVAPALREEIMAREASDTGPGKVVFRPDSGNPELILCGDNDWPIIDIDMEGSFDHKADMCRLNEAVFQHYFPSGVGDLRGHLFNVPQSRIYITRDRNLDNSLRYWKATWMAGEYGGFNLNHRESKHPGKDCHTEPYEPTPAEMGAFQVLWEQFGGTINAKGFKNLDSHVGLVYGDSITLTRCERILSRLHDLGFASDNAVLGIGSFTYQYMTRDTFGLAIKATWAQVDGVGYDLQKTPATDSGVKHSAKGLMRVELEKGEYVLYQEQNEDQEMDGELEVIFKDGQLYNQTTLSDMRQSLWPVAM